MAKKVKRSELYKSTTDNITSTKDALQLVYDTLNNGQQKKLLKEEQVKNLFDRHGVKHSE